MIQCQFENGGKKSLRHVTLGAIVVKNGKILLAKRSPNLINPNKYCVPGGFLERDETMAEGALRELREETGYAGKINCLFRVNDSPCRPQEDRQNVDVVFIVDVLEKVGEPDGEVTEVKWFNLNNLPPKDQSKDQFAFDHFENIQFYLQYLKNPSSFRLPIFNLNI